MKRSIFLLVLCSLFCSISVCAQNDFYYYRGQKINIQRDETKICVITPKTETAVFTTAKGIEQKNIFDNQYNIVVYSTNDVTTARSLNQALTTSINKATSFTLPCYKTMSGEGLNMTPYLYVKLKKEEDYATLKEQAEQNSLTIVSQNEFMPLWYTLLLTPQSAGNTLEIANGLYETGLFAAAAPDFSCVQLDSFDEHFSLQWGLFNNDYPGIDIKASAAWSYATGRGSKIAIVDNGMQQNHQDLIENIYMGYDATTGTFPHTDYSYDDEDPINFGGHGEHCAGIAIAAQNNSYGISGVAPDAYLMPVSVKFGETTTTEKLADGINWAWKNGADVISCSWGGGLPNELINEAIDSAIVKGRNGKGAILINSAGNINNNSINSDITYPGTYRDEIIVVGAINKNGYKRASSCYGLKLDVMAPGEDIYSTISDGYAAYGYKSGTSMAAPHVAGLAALILERNPNLTGQQVRNIIEQNTTKIDASRYPYSTVSGRPNGTWNQYCGYGLINAYEAVKNTPRW